MAITRSQMKQQIEKGNKMPKVGGKHFSYDKKGKSFNTSHELSKNIKSPSVKIYLLEDYKSDKNKSNYIKNILKKVKRPLKRWLKKLVKLSSIKQEVVI